MQLETKLSYLEDFVSNLESVVLEQSSLIKKLQSENTLIRSKIDELLSYEEPLNKPPPHY
ncbi:MAG: SlyX family protein [Treponemataceae bacterium]